MVGKHTVTLRIGVVAAALALAGCADMHLHDPGRLKAAGEATRIAKEFSSEGTAVFDPMEQNLDAFTAIERDILALANEHELETFIVVLSGFNADEVSSELLDTMADWSANISDFDAAEREAVAAVNAALDRRDEVAKALAQQEQGAGAKTSTTVDGTLERLENRLETMEQRAKQFITAFDVATGLANRSATGNVADMSDEPNENVAKVRGWIKAASEALDEVDKDEQLVAARALLAATIQEQLASEARRIAEYRRYLGEVKRLRQTFDTRERVAVCQLFVPAVERLLAGVADPEELAQAYERFALESRYTDDDFCAFANIRRDDEKVRIIAEDQEDWGNGDHTLAQYVSANIQRLGEGAEGPTLVAALGILAFVERPFLDDAVNQLYIEGTRHALRLSKINAQQRADLLRDLAASLEIYEQGGIKPEEVARLALFASQVGALFFIGTQN
jgi:hypothetical protein